MAYFNAGLNITSAEIIDGGWKIISKVIDKSGNFYASSASVGNVIYIDDSFNNNIQRFIITEIINARGMTIEANIKWAKNNEDPIDPLVGFDAIIGESSKNNSLIALTSGNVNLIPEQFLNAIRNYENFENIDNLSKIDSPDFSGKPTVPTPERDSNDFQIVNSEWVNKKLENIAAIKEFIAGEKIPKNVFVYLSNDDKVLIASNSNIESSDCIIGITLNECEENQLVEVLMDGELENLEWDFKKSGETLFIGNEGQLLLNPDSSSKYIQQVAISIDINSIRIDIDDAILL